MPFFNSKEISPRPTVLSPLAGIRLSEFRFFFRGFRGTYVILKAVAVNSFPTFEVIHI